MMQNEKAKLLHIVKSHSELATKIKELKFEQKELEDSAFEACGSSAKAVKQLSKESLWDEVKRAKQTQLEEEIDAGRLALGMLADTPLGAVEMERMETEKQQSLKNGNAKKRAKGKAESRPDAN